ncbi:HAD family phosphatase [Pedobacter sp. ISL-68]|uniref:HAD family hydrolase n=1 Tax=unclassified Pedobacter TaxID=2628915 RepID=UPI001BE7CCDE|nr:MULTISPECIES: HAD family phosphatase [unclassified Pedobacter]MBT2560023.1 HAD family phosphatase [Pedobacter sp. ISL-64]MBT2592327.1 HAD family phosphatase [Pedobacter sp. ISL-68]
MSKIKALLFDLDGTLIDSEQFHFDCWNKFLCEYEVTLDFKDWLTNYAGIPLPKNAKTIIDRYKIEEELAGFINRREKITFDGFRTTDIQLMPFALEFIKFAYEKGLILAVVTASPKIDVEAVFERNGLAKYFSLFITRTDVSKSKPDPESYNLCVARLGVEKDECIVFEDTLNGVKSALAAGITCYAIQSNVRAHQKLKIADELFLSFANAKEFMLQKELI